MSVLKLARDVFELYGAAESMMPSPTQAKLAKWQGSKFGAPPIEQMTLGVSEELGELAEAFGAITWTVGRLAHAVLKHRQKTRGGGDIDVLRARAVDALGDMMVFAASVATILRVDLLTVYRETAEEVMARGGDALPSIQAQVIEPVAHQCTGRDGRCVKSATRALPASLGGSPLCDSCYVEYVHPMPE